MNREDDRVARPPRQSAIGAALGLMLMMLALSGCATSKEAEAMRAEISALQAEQEVMQRTITERESNMAQMIVEARKENELLRESIDEAQETLRRNNAAQGIDLEQMRDELDRLRGAAEETDFRLAKMEQDVKLFKEDVEMRLEGVSDALELPKDAGALYELGQQKLKAGEHRDARKVCEAFVSRHPEDTRVDDAIYCVGESYFLEKQYVSAVYEYQKIIKNYYDTSKRVPDAALRIGQSFKALGKCTSSLPFFELVTTEFKRSAAFKQAKAELEAKCADEEKK